MTSKQRSYLKGLAMNLDPIFQIGKSSLTPEVTQAVSEALEARELVKITVLKNCLDDGRSIAEVLGEATFLENAIIKAQAAVEETGLMAIADDSGLVVDALDGEPGVYSARYAGVHGDDAANNAKLLVNLEGVADEDRTARFMSVVALIDTDGLVTYGEGACEGVIAHEGRGDHGFGYDPLFLPVDTPGKTMAELTADEKNAISHRFHALEHLSAKLTGEE